jgi:hypothetical protein
MQGTQFGKSLFFSPVPPLNTCVSVCQWSGKKGGSHTWQTAAYQQYTTLQQAWLLVQSPKEVRTQWYVLVSQLESIILLFIMHLKFAFLCTCFNRSRKKGNSTARWNDLFWQAELGLSTSYTFFFAPSNIRSWIHIYTLKFTYCLLSFINFILKNTCKSVHKGMSVAKDQRITSTLHFSECSATQ